MYAVGIGVNGEAEKIETGFHLEINGWAVEVGGEGLLKVCGMFFG